MSGCRDCRQLGRSKCGSSELCKAILFEVHMNCGPWLRTCKSGIHVASRARAPVFEAPLMGRETCVHIFYMCRMEIVHVIVVRILFVCHVCVIWRELFHVHVGVSVGHCPVYE